MVIQSLEGFHIISNDFKSINYNELLNKILLGDSIKLQEIANEYTTVNDNKSVLFLIFNVKDRNKKKKNDEREDEEIIDDHFVNAFVIKSSKETNIILTCSPDCKKQHAKKVDRIKNALQKKFSDNSTKVIENYEDKFIDASLLALSFNKIKNFIKFLEANDSKRDFSEVDFYAYDETFQFEVEIIKFNFERKEELETILLSLNLILKKIEDYVLDDKLLEKLSEVLVNETFQHSNDDKIDHRKEVIKIVLAAMQKGQQLNEVTKVHFKTFVEEDRKLFQNEIEELKEKLKKSTKAKGCMNMVLDKRTELLKSIYKIDSSVLEYSDLVCIFDLFADRREQSEPYSYIEDVIILQSELICETSVIDVETFEKMLKIMIDTQNQELCCSFIKILNTIQVIPERTAEEKLNEEKLIEEQKKLIEEQKKPIEKKLTDEHENSNEKKLIMKYKKKLTLKDALSEVLMKIPQKNADLVLTLAKKLGLGYHNSLVLYLYEIIIESDVNENRKNAFLMLRQLENIDPELSYVSQLLRIEEQVYRNNRNTITTDLLELVKSRQRISKNCFVVLRDMLLHNDVPLILEEIVENNLQTLPSFLVQKIKDNLKSIPDKIEKKESLLKLCGVLITGKYASLEEFYKETKFKEIFENEKSLLNIFLQIVGVEYQNNVPLPDDVIQKVKKEAVKNENAENLLNLIERKRNDIDIIKNPRLTIDTRKEALEQICVDFKDNKIRASSLYIKAFMDLIKTEPELRQAAFSNLLKMLPNDYSTEKNYASSVNLKVLADCILNEPFIINDLAILMKKDKNADLGPLVHPLINRIYLLNDANEINIAIDLLNFISSLSNGSKHVMNNLRELLDLGLSSQKSSIKNTVVKILIENKISENEIIKYVKIEEWKSLQLINKSLSTSSIEDKLKIVEYCIMNECLLPEDVVKGLVNDLKKQSNEQFQQQIVELLLRVDNTQELDEALVLGVIKIIEMNQNLLKQICIICLLGNFVRRGFEIPVEVSNLMWKGFTAVNNQDKNLTFNLLLTARAIVFQQKTVPSSMVITLKNILVNHEDLKFRIICAQIFSCLFKRNICNKDVFRRAMLDVALETLDSNKIDGQYLNFVAFDALKYKIEKNAIEAIDLMKFYNGFRRQFKSNNEGWGAFENYLNGDSSYVEKYFLLATLNKIYFNQQEINATIFTQFDSKNWRKELLCHELISQIMSASDKVKESVNEFDLMEFNENVYAVEVKFLKNMSEIPGYFIERVIEELIEKQAENALSLSEINLILFLLKTNLENLRVFEEIYSNDFRFAVKIVLIQQKLNDLEIEYNEETLMKLSKLLQFKLQLINNLFSNKNTGIETTIEGLIVFFEKLDSCSLSKENKNLFIINELLREKTIENWLYKLNNFIIRSLIGEKVAGNITKDEKLILQLYDYLTKLLLNNWSLETIESMIELIKTEKIIKDLIDSLVIIAEYSLKEYETDIQNKSIIEIYKTKSSSEWSKRMNNLAIVRTFEGSFDKNLEQLCNELLELNKDSDSVLSIFQNDKLINEYKAVMSIYETKTKKWSESDIKKWAKEIKNSKDKTTVSQNEKLAVVIRAVELSSKYSPRAIQVLSIIIMLNTESGKGRLSQINTGEGKTTVVAMLAVLKALDGHQVDIVTSSTELAVPQSKEQKKFYKKFDLDVSHNSKDDPVSIKKRYKADIVYGAANDFQGDILRDEYSKMGTRSGRKCDVAIVDEVDSMLIDGKNHIVMLSSPMPAMDHLEPLLASIWIQIEQTAKCLKEIDGKVYYVSVDEGLTDDGKLIEGLPETYLPIDSTKEEFVKKCTEKHLRKLIRDTENIEKEDLETLDKYPEVKVPKHLREFVCKTQLTKWIDSAIHARYRCKLGQHYIIKGTKIAPVDAQNTGVVQANMHWSNGLHQFLEIKHGAKITAESLTTNFISNVTYFRRYGSNIFGLTGTLGSKSAQKLLSNTYRVDCVVIPPFRKKQYKELTPVITRNKVDWYKAIVQSSLSKLKVGRGVLVITKYINEVDEISKQLIHDYHYEKSKIKLYKTENDSKVIQEEIKPGEIIIATNIAGRGTDIKAEKIEANGGLHVCVTFLPPNERVEQQNVGRTSRTGNKGTGQFIILQGKQEDTADDGLQFECGELFILKQLRNAVEEDNLKRAEAEIEKVTLKDEVFFEFCKLLDEIEDKNIPHIGIKKRAVEERFGLWLRIKEDNELKDASVSEAIELFKKFRDEILEDKGKDKLIQNPVFHIKCGNDYLDNDKKLEAVKEYDKAIELDDHFLVNAYYNRGFARISHFCGKWKEETEEAKRQTHEAVKDFKKAKQIIEDNLEPLLNIIQRASNAEALSEQVAHKLTLYGVQKNAIENAVGTDVQKEIDFLEKQKKTEGIKQEDINSINKQLEELNKNREQREKGVIGTALSKGRDVEIELIEVEKCLPEDQDIDTYEFELDEYKNNGFRGSFSVTEVTPIDWWSVIGLTLLAIGQIVGGAALAVFSLGAGSSLAMGLITEGVSDLITAVVDGIIFRNFSWQSWAIQKAISITVSLVCAGVGAIKDIAKTAVAGVKAAASIGKTAITATVKVGWKIAAKMIGSALAKGIAKKLINHLVDLGVEKALMPSIYDEVMKRVEEPIQKALLSSSFVKDMLELDGKNRNSYFQSLIKRKAFEILNPKNDPNHPLATIAVGIAKGIASQKIKGLSTILQVTEAMEALNKLATFVPTFIDDLKKEIEEIHKNEEVAKRLEEMKEIETRVNQDETTRNNQNQSENVNIQYNPGDDDLDIEDEIGNDDAPQEQVKLTRVAKSPDDLSKHLSGSVSSHMCTIIQGKFISPVTHAGVDFGVNSLTAGLDKAIMKDLGNYQAERRVEFFQNKDIDRIPDEFKEGLKDQAAVDKAHQIIDDVKKGGEAGLPHLGALSDEAGRPINVYDDKGNLIRTIGSDKNGPPIDIEYHKPNADNPNGHWTLPGGEESSFSNVGNKNCLFNVVAQQCGKQPNEMRENTAKLMESNIESLANQANDIKRLEIYKSSALIMGGMYQDKTGKLIVEANDMNLLDQSLAETDNSKKRGGRYGMEFKAGVPKTGIIDPSLAPSHQEYSMHHICPNGELENLISQNPAETQAERMNKIQDYVNQPHIKDVIINKGLLTKNIRGIGVNHGALIHASVSWNPHNLVYGPKGSYRANEPADKTDTAILNKQSTGYQTAFNNFNNNKTLENFGKLPPTNPVNFQKKPVDVKYHEV